MVKPSRLVRVGDVLEVEKAALIHVVRVEAELEKRVGAKRVMEFLTDLTPEEAKEKAMALRLQSSQNRVYQGKEGGRPTKKDRRTMDDFEEGPLA